MCFITEVEIDLDVHGAEIEAVDPEAVTEVDGQEVAIAKITGTEEIGTTAPRKVAKGNEKLKPLKNTLKIPKWDRFTPVKL